MNQIENNLKQALHNAVQKAFDTELDTASIVIEIPKDKVMVITLRMWQCN